MRIAILDDDQNDVSTLESYLKRYQSERGTDLAVDAYMASFDFLEEYRSNYDVVILDIEMPGTNGMNVAREIRKKDQAVGIIFVTNMAQYAIAGYEVNAIDFIVKPVGYFNFARKLERALSFVRKREEKALVLSDGEGMRKVPVADILYIEKNGNYARFVTVHGSFQERGTMQAVKEKMYQYPFSECTSGCLVNLRHVERIGKDTVLIGTVELPLSRRMRKKFTQDYVDYVGGGF